MQTEMKMGVLRPKIQKIDNRLINPKLMIDFEFDSFKSEVFVN